MKRIIFFVMMMIGIAHAQSLPSIPGYTKINDKYNWLGGRFAQLHLPAYGDTTKFAGQAVQAGAVLIDTTGSNKGLYVHYDGYWHRVSLSSEDNQIDVFLIAGQSNAVGNSDNAAAAPTPVSGSAYQFYHNSLSPAVEPIGSSTGSAWPAFAVSYFKLTGRKICFVPAAANGTSMVSAASVGFGTWDTTGTLYNRSVLMVDSATTALTAAGYTPTFKGVLFCQGETDGDGINRGVITQSDYSAALAKLIKNYRLRFGPQISFNISRIGFRTDTIQTGYLAVQAAQVALANPDSLINVTYWNAPYFPVRGLMDDIYHYKQAGYNEMGRMMAEEYINSTSNNFQTQAGNLFFKKGNVAIGDITPTSPLHIYKTGTGAEIKIYDSLATAVRVDIENKVDDAFASSAVWFRTHNGLRSQIGAAASSSLSGGDISFFNSTPGIVLCSDNGDLDFSTGTGSTNLIVKSRLRVKNNGQVSIAPNTDPHASAQLDIVSTTKGLRIPTMNSTQMNAISSPASGLLIYNTDSAKHCYYTGSAWACYGSGGGSVSSNFNSVLTAGPDLSDDYISDFNNHSWNWQSVSDFTVHSDAGGTVRLKLASTESSMFAPDGVSGFTVDNSVAQINAGGVAITSGSDIVLTADSTYIDNLGFDVDTSIHKPVVYDIVHNTLRYGAWQGNGGGGGSTAWNGITNPTGSQTLTFDDAETTSWTNNNDTETLLGVTNNSLTSGTGQAWSSSSITSGNLASYTSTSTAANGFSLINATSSGANASSTRTATGITSSVTNTGTSSTNIAGRFVASGGTNNYAISTTGTVIVNDFNIATAGIGTPAMAVRSTTNDITGAIVIANNGNYSNLLSLAPAFIQASDDLRITATGGDLGVNVTRSMFGTTAAATSTLQTNASFAAAITSTSADLTLSISHYTVKVDASGAGRTITLPAASGCTGRIYIVKKMDSSGNTVTVDGNASETIDGATTKVISTQYAGVSIQSDGTNWVIIGTF